MPLGSDQSAASYQWVDSTRLLAVTREHGAIYGHLHAVVGSARCRFGPGDCSDNRRGDCDVIAQRPEHVSGPSSAKVALTQRGPRRSLRLSTVAMRAVPESTTDVGATRTKTLRLLIALPCSVFWEALWTCRFLSATI
ncbi:unnamed protein product [Heligmosomoides polygyrus]|uniref:Uncharacterized protein n=1 Tax=Heligmosomoides polygyrus TaxID=6339 RepID=A0A183GFZ9_HELPZ|nr:unnamed protein product [Heligmosomoides polygyrus]